MASSVNVGDKVTTTAQTDIYGTHLASFVRVNTYDVIAVRGSNITIGKGSAVTAVVDLSTLSVVGAAATNLAPQDTPDVPAPDTTTTTGTQDTILYVTEDRMSSSGIESALTALINAGATNDVYKYSMRLFGIPHQFTKYCDYRSYSDKADDMKTVGRKFIENIMLEAPVVTFVPGKPLYLPSAKNKQATSAALIAAANSTIATATAVATVSENSSAYERMRYYDFQQDYLNYMKYVNIMCASAASFLELDNDTLDGTSLSTYDWKNYRWTASNYKTATGAALSTGLNAVTTFVNSLKTYGKEVLDTLNNVSNDNGENPYKALNEDEDLLAELENIMTQLNFVQFYADASVGASETASNETAASRLEGMFDSANETLKEVAFTANSAGLDAAALQDSADDITDALNSMLFSGSDGTISGTMSRVLSSVSNVIKGDSMIMPQIYQRSSYDKSYSVSIDLRSPYGTKKAYFLNVLVPLFHALCLAIPKQSTANTYGAPFLVKVYFPGGFSCNLGIIQSISVEKNPNGDSWTVDGYPSEIKITMNVVDLYSDLSMSPAGDTLLFLSNSSLIEYIATCCGVNLTVPQIRNRISIMATAVVQGLESFKDDVSIGLFSGAENLIAAFTGV